MGCGPIAHVGDLESVYSSALETGFVKDEVVEVQPRISLHVIMGEAEASSPLRRWPHGAWFSDLRVGEKLTITQLTVEPSFDCMGARQRQQDSKAEHKVWPDIPRCSTEKRFWRAQVTFEDEGGRTLLRSYALQVATSPSARVARLAEGDLNDAKEAATYAHEFNKHLLAANDQDFSKEVKPGVQVCIPIVCEVIDCSMLSICAPGDAVLLIPYPGQEITKFVCSGEEAFHEVPHAFFHFAAWWSSFSEFVCDIQGAESADGGFLLIDPMILRTYQQPLGKLFGLESLFSDGKPIPTSDEAVGPSIERFNFAHRKCGPLCKTFDARRTVGKGWRGAMTGLWHCGALGSA
mmetsp:Transcript_52800/g.123503  ORF Transcript_52800/g.123503 Transcript_52800/m.123503 type:complete len:349 (+) Transcript_52800:101-1147(+)